MKTQLVNDRRLYRKIILGRGFKSFFTNGIKILKGGVKNLFNKSKPLLENAGKKILSDISKDLKDKAPNVISNKTRDALNIMLNSNNKKGDLRNLVNTTANELKREGQDQLSNIVKSDTVRNTINDLKKTAINEGIDSGYSLSELLQNEMKGKGYKKRKYGKGMAIF